MSVVRKIDWKTAGLRGPVVACRAAIVCCVLLVGACSGGGGGGSTSTAPIAVAPPVVQSQPQSVRVLDGQPASFAVAVVSAAAPSYQWFRAGVAIAGANAATYTIPAAQLSDDNATFTVAVTNAGGTVQSATATLNVGAVAPSISNNVPVSLSVIAGQPATFTVTASGSAPLVFQWRRGGVAIAGATDAGYTIAATAASDNGATFDVVVSNGAGTATSAVFTLTVTVQAQAPSISTQPQSVTVREGDPATFSVVAAGTAPFSYQWLRNGSAIVGAQASSYTLSNTTPGDSGALFSVVVTNPAGTVASTPATLTVTPQPSLSLLAGNIGGPGTIDGTGLSARFMSPAGVALDNADAAYVADGTTVRKVTSSGVVTTLAGSPTVSGSADGSGSAASFNVVAAVAVDGAGNVYVADSTANTIRKITPAGVVTTLAGAAIGAGSTDGPGASARFRAPSGLAVDSAGNVYVADSGNQTIRKIDTNLIVTTLAGSVGVAGSTDGAGTAALFNSPTAVAVDSSGNVYVADLGNSTIREVTPGGVVSTLAGMAGTAGSTDGIGAAALFRSPSAVAVDGVGNVYVGDGLNGTIRRITPARDVTTLAGSATVLGSADGTGAAASFSGALGLASTANGTLTVADRGNFEIRTVTTGGTVTTIAGAVRVSGGADGTRSAATFTAPYGIAVDGSGTLYVSDNSNMNIRKVTAGGVVTTFAGPTGPFFPPGSSDGAGSAARFNAPRGVAVSASGTIYVADSVNHAIRAISPAGVVTTLAGNPSTDGSADGSGALASFSAPSAIAIDGAGNLFVVDTANSTIRKVTAAGVVTTFAGRVGVAGSADGTGAAASFNSPSGIAIDSTGNLYVTDTGNFTIRKITPAQMVSTLAGTAGQQGSTDGASSVARFGTAIGIAVNPAGTVFVADTGNRTIRKIDGTGTVTTVVGRADGRIGVMLGALPGALDVPKNLALDASGTLYCTDENGVLTITSP